MELLQKLLVPILQLLSLNTGMIGFIAANAYRQ